MGGDEFWMGPGTFPSPLPNRSQSNRLLWAQGAQGQTQKGYSSSLGEGRKVRVGYWGHVPATATALFLWRFWSAGELNLLRWCYKPLGGAGCARLG